MKLIGISGSLRRASFNSALLRAALELSPPGVDLDIRTIEAIPLYNGDIEQSEGAPAAVVALKDAIAAADGLVLATPEYNNSVPGVFKNAIDWLSRPASDLGRVFGGKPVALIGASSGGFGTVLSQSAWLPVFRALGVQPWTGGQLLVSRAGEVFDHQGQMTDEKVRERLRKFMAGFIAFAQG